MENSSTSSFSEQGIEDAISYAERSSYARMDWGWVREKVRCTWRKCPQQCWVS